MKLWTLHSTEAPTGTVAQSTRESQEANDGLISVREPFVAIVATVSVLCSRAAALAARDNELFNWVGKWEKRWNFYDNHIFGSSGKNSLLSKWLMLWFSACFTFLINMSKGGHDLKRVRRQKSYRFEIVNSGCHLSYPFLHFEINLHMSYQNRQLRVSFLIQYSPFSRSTFICHTIKFVLS